MSRSAAFVSQAKGWGQRVPNRMRSPCGSLLKKENPTQRPTRPRKQKRRRCSTAITFSSISQSRVGGDTCYCFSIVEHLDRPSQREGKTRGERNIQSFRSGGTRWRRSTLWSFNSKRPLKEERHRFTEKHHDITCTLYLGSQRL